MVIILYNWELQRGGRLATFENQGAEKKHVYV